MKLILRQRFISFFHQSFDVYDENESKLYEIKPEVSLFRKHKIIDRNGNVLMMIKRRYMRLMARNDICDKDGKLLYIVKRKVRVFSKKHKVSDMVNKDIQYDLSGDILGWGFKLTKDKELVATFEKKIIALTDTFTINVVDPSDALLALSICVALDNAHHSKQKRWHR